MAKNGQKWPKMGKIDKKPPKLASKPLVASNLVQTDFKCRLGASAANIAHFLAKDLPAGGPQISVEEGRVEVQMVR